MGKKCPKKSLAVPKKIGRGDPLVSPGMVWYAGKQEKPFWFSSLDQIVHFGPIIFRRTFKNYFGQFVWIEKNKRKVTIIVAFQFMKRRLKTGHELLVLRPRYQVRKSPITTVPKDTGQVTHKIYDPLKKGPCGAQYHFCF